jgi:FMN phosphatase YigB (HAD superfamily)
MNKPILFVDFDGTICFDRYWRSLQPEKFEMIQKLIFGEDKTLLNNWMRGVYTAEEINKIVSENIGVPYEELWDLFVKDCETMQVSKDVLEKLNGLRSKYIVILVTGNMDSFSRFTVPALELDKYFDHINNSFFDGKLKTDNKGQVFIEYAKAFGVALNECIFLDNSPKACEVFDKLGGKAFLITPERNIGYYLDKLWTNKQ